MDFWRARLAVTLVGDGHGERRVGSRSHPGGRDPPPAARPRHCRRRLRDPPSSAAGTRVADFCRKFKKDFPRCLRRGGLRALAICVRKLYTEPSFGRSCRTTRNASRLRRGGLRALESACANFTQSRVSGGPAGPPNSKFAENGIPISHDAVHKKLSTCGRCRHCRRSFKSCCSRPTVRAPRCARAAWRARARAATRPRVRCTPSCLVSPS